MSLISLKDIHKTYYIGGKIPVHALQGVSLDIEPGEFVAIMGPSGSGKSTLLAILGLLDKADSGQYKLVGSEIGQMGEKEYASLRSRFFGFVFQTFNLLPKLNVVDNVMLPFIYSGQDSTEKREHALKTLERIGLQERLHHRPNEISGGQQQRVALARALANKPLVILADEPTGNLDSKSSQEIMELLKQLNDEGNTILMVTHEHDIAAWASRILTLSDGKIVNDEKRKKTKSTTPVEKDIDLFTGQKRFTFGGLKNYCYEAYLSIINNKLRSILSILGVMVGVAAVVAMLALGTGAKRNMEETFSSLGTNVLMVRTARRSGGISLGSDAAPRFNFADYATLSGMESVEQVIPYVSGRAQVVYQNKNWNTSVTGTSTDYAVMKKSEFDFGRFFTKAEDTTRAKVVVLGRTVADELFGEDDPVGRFVKINRVNFNVVGVLEKQGAMGWRNFDDQVFLPVKTAMDRLLGKDYIDYFEVQVDSLGDMNKVSEDIVTELLRTHRLNESDRQSFDITNMAEIQAAATSMITTLAYLLGSVAAVSLLVGGIGIMNIMLVMVMERTHEIGLRKALGAQRGDILTQFLVEAVLICSFGGIVGIILGAGISWLLSAIAQWVIFISPGSIILAFTFSVVIGIVFGLWPAWRASKLLPIVALRYE
ncbi:MAG: ABC transporter permease [bacterium]|nr:ABC transporter permease [Candidatus Margulisiibacteriota bacterium]